MKNFLYFFVKRTFDIFASLILIVLLIVPMFIIGIINVFPTKGAPFYLDKRVGKKGKIFKLIKYRSMYKDANTRLEHYLTKEQLEEFKTERKMANDPRITPFGNFLRKTSLDELPQLFNIFIGSMSFVGPRAVVLDELEQNYSKDEFNLIVSVRPGLLSNWGVNGRSNVNYKNGERQRLELEYFKKRSLIFDLKIIFKAFGAVISQNGAQ